MSIGRVTQTMMTQRALTGLNSGLSRISTVQEQLSTGRIINRPSDDPTGAAAAMRLRSALADQVQYARNADDAVGWLDQLDSALAAGGDQLRRARDLALQGANSGALGDSARQALAVEVDQIRAGLVATANTTYLDRPVFGGVTGGDAAYETAADGSVAYAGTRGRPVERVVGDGVTVRVDLEGPQAFGEEGDSVFDHLTALSDALRGNDQSGISAAIEVLKSDGERVASAQAEIGTRTTRVERAGQAAGDSELSLTSSLSEVENTDLARATVDLQLQQVAYQAALAATARVIQPSLMDFLR